MSTSTSPLPLPLPDGWSPLEVVSDTVVAAGLTLRRAGLASRGPDGTEITGSAAERFDDPAARAGFELMERIATVGALGRDTSSWSATTVAGDAAGDIASAELFPAGQAAAPWRFARSNGAELAERDRILRSWYGDISPVRADAPAGVRGAEGYVWRAAVFPDTGDLWSADLAVAAVIGFPTATGSPLALGYGANPDAGAALDRAGREALQSLAFLWGEPIPDQPPAALPSAGGHLEHWLYPRHHEWLLGWLDGAHARFRGRRTRRDGSAATRYVDLTPAWFGPGLRVAKAVCPRAEPLAFGLAPFAEHLPPDLRIHPIV